MGLMALETCPQETTNDVTSGNMEVYGIEPGETIQGCLSGFG